MNLVKSELYGSSSGNISCLVSSWAYFGLSLCSLYAVQYTNFAVQGHSFILRRDLPYHCVADRLVYPPFSDVYRIFFQGIRPISTLQEK
ncbi:hypothetical protein C7475_11259 [Chitinophaga sp. S165]|nr:hypothetical protein C7475_11259 [Chitinophaga sp. S165]